MMQLSTPLTLLAMTWMSGTNARIGDGGRRNLVDSFSKLKTCNPNQNPTYTPECLSEGKGYTCTNVNLGSRNGDYRCVDKSQSSPTIAPTPADITEDECAVLTGKATGYSWCKLTRTCLAPGDDTCKKADCGQNSGSTGYSWCVFTRSCIAPSVTCEAQTCESNSDCPPTTTCVTLYGGPSRCGSSTPHPSSSPTLSPTPADITEDECAVLTGKATGYSWCKLTSTCLAPGDDACKKADCEQNSGSTGYSWCVFNRSCIAPSATCEAQTCESTSDCPPTTTCMIMYGGPSRCGQ